MGREATNELPLGNDEDYILPMGKDKYHSSPTSRNGIEDSSKNSNDSDDPPANSGVNESQQEGNDDTDAQAKVNEREDNSSLRRGTRVRKKFDPNHMPSGTLEIKRLNEQIGMDSETSEDSESVASISVPEEREPQGNEIPGACMAFTVNEVSLPKSWKQALYVPEWERARRSEIKEL